MKYSEALEKINDKVENIDTSKKLLDAFLSDKDESFLKLVSDVHVHLDDEEYYYLSFEVFETSRIHFLLNLYREIPVQDREKIISYCNLISYDTIVHNFNDALRQLNKMRIDMGYELSALFLKHYMNTIEELIKEHSLTFKSAKVYITEILKDLCEE